MSRLFLNIFTAVITTMIGIFTGRAMKRYDLEEEISRSERRTAIAEYQYKYFRDEYMRNIRLNKMKAKIKPIRRDNVEKQVDHKSTKEKQLEIINHYGMEKQLDQLLEESGELIVAIAKNKRYSFSDAAVDHYENLVEEMADVKNLIEQIELKSPYIKDGIEVMTRHKTERELDRIRRSTE